jgi:hypothetical protein
LSEGEAKEVMKNARSMSAVAGIVLGLTTLTGASSADTLPPRPLPELTAEWWQWVYSIPQPVDDATGGFVAPFNPLLDTSGVSCMVGQRGSVWFLAGTNGSIGPVTRSCSVPEGASLFFPVINFVNFNTPGCPPGTLNMTAQQLRAPLQPAIDAVNSNPLSVKVDGVDVKKTLLTLVQSEPFELAFPTENIFGPAICSAKPAVPLAAGIYSPAVAEGYYVWLPPLTRGQHTINFYASELTSSFFGANTQNVAYTITVVPVSPK